MSKLICIDPGHGGSDRANRGKKGYVEADGMLKLSLYLKAELEQQGFKVIMTRESDRTISLTDRANFATKNKADLFISQHSNAGGGRGVEVIYSIRQPHMKVLANNITNTMAMTFNTTNRGAKTRESQKYSGQDYFTVINNTSREGIPVLLIENFFHDNLLEESYLLNDEKLKIMANIQCTCICQSLGVKYKEIEVVKFNLDGNLFEINGSLINGSNLVEARPLLENIGYSVGWDNKNKVILATKQQ